MRAATLLLAAAIGLTGCSNNDQAGNTQNVDEKLTAETISSNDVTAIDAVTAEAANMAADVEFNDVDNDLDNEDTAANAAAPAKPAPSSETTANSAANAAD